MTAQKHTPGPWEVYEQPIASKADAILELIEQVQATEPVADHIYLINAGGKCPATTGCGPTSRANARLIAAAPEMLEALKAAIANSDANIGPHGRTPEAQAVYDQVSDAIDKAEGRT